MNHRVEIGHYLRRAASVISIVALSVITTLFVQHLVTPSPVSAQPATVGLSNQDFVVTGGTGMLGRLGPGPEGNGNLRLWDLNGYLRVQIAGNGTIAIYDTSGNTVWSAP
jgi:hypothetical protein